MHRKELEIKMFLVDFIDDFSCSHRVQNTELGEIVIGEHREFFHASLSYWNRDQYLNQWKEGLEKICTHRACSSVITDMYDPKSSNIAQWWVFRPEQDIVFVRNELVFLEKVDSQLFEQNIYQYIQEKPSAKNKGRKISEWQIKISELIEFSQSFELS
jgi:hypothetical protein